MLFEWLFELFSWDILSIKHISISKLTQSFNLVISISFFIEQCQDFQPRCSLVVRRLSLECPLENPYLFNDGKLKAERFLSRIVITYIFVTCNIHLSSIVASIRAATVTHVFCNGNEKISRHEIRQYLVFILAFPHIISLYRVSAIYMCMPETLHPSIGFPTP